MSSDVLTSRFAALKQLLLSRIRLFLREPAAVFWVYGFPILLLLTLGMAFRDSPPSKIAVDLVGHGDLDAWKNKLARSNQFSINMSPEDWQKRLQSGKTDLVIEISGDA